MPPRAADAADAAMKKKAASPSSGLPPTKVAQRKPSAKPGATHAAEKILPPPTKIPDDKVAVAGNAVPPSTTPPPSAPTTAAPPLSAQWATTPPAAPKSIKLQAAKPSAPQPPAETVVEVKGCCGGLIDETKCASMKTSLLRTALTVVLARALNDPATQVALPVALGKELHHAPGCAERVELATVVVNVGTFIILIVSQLPRSIRIRPELAIVPAVLGMVAGGQVNPAVKKCYDVGGPNQTHHPLYLGSAYTCVCLGIFCGLISIKKILEMDDKSRQHKHLTTSLLGAAAKAAPKKNALAQLKAADRTKAAMAQQASKIKEQFVHSACPPRAINSPSRLP